MVTTDTARKRTLRPIDAGEPNGVYDIDPATVSEDLVKGADVMKAPEVPSLTIRGTVYKMPTLGPLVVIEMTGHQIALTEAQERANLRLFDLKEGLSKSLTPEERQAKEAALQTQAFSETGMNDVLMNFLKFIAEMGEDAGIPWRVLRTLTYPEIMELQSQFRPFDGDQGK